MTLILAAVPTIVVLAAQPALAQAGVTGDCATTAGLGVSCSGGWGSGGGDGGSGSGDGGGGGGGVRRVDPLLVGHVVTAGTAADGTGCLTLGQREFPGIQGAETANRTAFLRLERSTDPMCPPVPGAPTVVTFSPEELAFAFWEEIDPPDPAPRVAPGWAITGLPSYLEPGVQPAVQETFDTDLGPLTITATGQKIAVDWGDGTTTGQVDAALGGSYPEGRITHTYTDVGTVAITVTQYWTGSWSIPNVGGDDFPAPLTQTGVIPEFEVEQVQAVIE